jgi:hypothetical protein
MNDFYLSRVDELLNNGHSFPPIMLGKSIAYLQQNTVRDQKRTPGQLFGQSVCCRMILVAPVNQRNYISSINEDWGQFASLLLSTGQCFRQNPPVH